MTLTSQSPEVRAVRETILGQSAASGLSGRLVTMLKKCKGDMFDKIWILAQLVKRLFKNEDDIQLWGKTLFLLLLVNHDSQ